MRIPTSVFVMSLVTAVPFGLAVRDTLHPRPKTLADMTDEEREAQFEADMQKQMEADRQAEEQRKKTVLGGLLGTPGKLGTYLDNLALDAPSETAETIRTRTVNASDVIDFTFDESQGKVTAIRIEAASGCDDLAQTIRGAWGDATSWSDAVTHTRTTFDRDTCTLRLDHYVELTQFVDKTLTATIPLAALGKPLDQIPNLDDAGEMRSPGLEHSTGETVVRFSTDDSNKIVGLSVTFSADIETDAAVRARLDKLLGKGKQDPDTGEWDWKGKTPVHYAYNDARVYLDVGQP